MTLKKKMMIKKRAVYTCLIAVLFFFAISVVNASLLDSIKNLFNGEPMFSPSQFNASIQIKGLPAEVITVVSVNDSSSGVSTINPKEGSTANVTITFIAEDPNGNGELPNSTSTPPLSYGAPGVAGRISMKLQKVIGTRPSLTISEGNITSCISVNPSPNSNQRRYVCNMTGLRYYYEPSASSGWFVNVSITDTPGTACTSYSCWNDTKTFPYSMLSAIQNSGGISWSNLDPEIATQTAATNLTLLNRGNQEHKTLGMKAYNLTGKSYPGTPNSYIPSAAIRTNTTLETECSATNLTGEITTEVGIYLNYSAPGAPVPQPASDNSTMYFCVFPILKNMGLSLGDTIYVANSTNPGSGLWIIYS